jgi:hypothetical protein
MATYRVRFVASFNITIDALGPREARTLASEMEALPWGSWAAAADAHEVRCAWNIIEPLQQQEPK